MSFGGYGAIAGAAGGFIQALAAGLAANAQRNALSNQLDKQQSFRNEALVGTFQPRLATSGVETAREQIGQGAAKREGAYGRIADTRLATGQQRATLRDKANVRMQGANRAGLAGYTDWQLDQLISNIRAQDELNRIANFAGGEARVFPYKMNEAAHEFDSLAFLGQLVSSMGGAAGNYAQLFGNNASQLPAVAAQAPMFDAGQGYNYSQFGNQA